MTVSVDSSRSMTIPVIIIVSALIIGTVVGIYWVLPLLKSSQQAWIAPSEGEQRIAGKNLYDQHCASCHGSQLEGQPNWRQRLDNGKLPAPPHDVSGHTWHHSDQDLIRMIQEGFGTGVVAPPGYQSDMPAYGSILTSTEIENILAYIKSTWPAKALEAQREMSLKGNHH